MAEPMEDTELIQPLHQAVILSHLPAEAGKRDDEKEVEQRVVIETDKGVSVQRYACDSDKQSTKLIWKEKISDDPEITADILDAIGQEFASEHHHRDAHAPKWHLKVRDDNQNLHEWDGSYGSSDLKHLSEYIRSSLDDDSLFLFDGNPDRIERIEIHYRRQSEIPLPEEWDLPHVTWDYHEQLILDRSRETIEYTRFVADETEISTKYHIAGGVSAFLDDFEPDLFTRIEGNPPDVYEDPTEADTYQIAVVTKNEGKREVSGSFDKKGLPVDFPDFIDDLLAFLDFYGHGEMVDDLVYGHVRRRQKERIFCNVEFEADGPTYCYLTDNDWYRPMDLVIVPAGEDNRETVGRIVTIEYHTEDQAPYPMDQIKEIIRPYDEEKDAGLRPDDL